MRYIKTGDGKVFDIEKIKREISGNAYYRDYEFSELEPYEEGIRLRYSAVGTEATSSYGQNGIRCEFSVDLNTMSGEFEGSDHLEDLADEWVAFDRDQNGGKPVSAPNEKGVDQALKAAIMLGMAAGLDCWLKGAIWTGKGLIYAMEMNHQGGWDII